MQVRANGQVIETSFSAWLGVLLMLLVADAGRRMERGTIRGMATARLTLALVTAIGRMAGWSMRPAPQDLSARRDHRVGA
jgi:predicted lipid-binding transport protein (Tim44 family)